MAEAMEESDDCLPMIFQTSNMSYEERYNVYWSLIFGNCKPREVRNKLTTYVANFVQKSGWKAIWCSDANDIVVRNKSNVNILVEIVDVHYQMLQAEINVSKPLVTDCHLTLQEIHKVLAPRDYQVPIIELLPVFDDSGDYDQTAIALEHVRFFYDNLWREWDKEDDGDYMYVARIVENRLRLYYDILEENYSKEFVQMYADTCDSYKQAVLDFAQLRKDMSASDSEQELGTSDVLKLAQKTNELEIIEKRLKTMENPQMRYFMALDNTMIDNNSWKALRDYPVTMIVSPRLLAKMCKMLTDDAIVEHYTSPRKAMGCCRENDQIIIYSGRYILSEENNSGPLVIQKSVVITGVGENVAIECSKPADVSVKISSPKLEMANMRFSQTVNSRILVVEKGKTVLRDCEFSCVSGGILVEDGAELVMHNCKITGALGAGLFIEPNTTVYLEGCGIYQNGKNNEDGGIKIVQDDHRPARVSIKDCKIEENFGYGISVVTTDTKNKLLDAGEFDTRLSGVHLVLNNNIICNRDNHS